MAKPKKSSTWGLEQILKAAEARVRRWPEWMQRPEHRQREPLGNRDPNWNRR